MNHRLTILGTAIALVSFASACSDDGGSAQDVDAAIVLPDPEADPTEFRITKMSLLDPHPFAIDQSFDVNTVVNDSITESIEMDTSDPVDGNLNLSIALVFRPLDTAAAASPMAITFPLCSAPLASTVCTQDATTMIVDTTASNMSADCLDALPNTLSDYDPIVPVPGPCFVSNTANVTVNLGTVTLPLRDAQIAATFSGATPSELTNGLLRGFVTMADADTILIPDSVALVGGMPLAALLKVEDMDTGPGDAMGWWFYISLEASLVDYVYSE